MWHVKDGVLYHGRDPVAIRRAVVEFVMGLRSGAVGAQQIRHMLRMERALSLLDLATLPGGTGP